MSCMTNDHLVTNLVRMSLQRRGLFLYLRALKYVPEGMEVLHGCIGYYR